MGILLAAMILVATGCTHASVAPLEQRPSLPNEQENKEEQEQTREQEAPGKERYNGTMTWELTDRAIDALCSARISATVQLSLHVTQQGTIKGNGTITYNEVMFDPSFVAPRCPSCHIIGTDGVFRITGQRVAGHATQLEVHPTLWSGLSEQQTTAQCRADAENGVQTTSHLLFSLQQAGFFDTWQVDTSGIPTTFHIDVAGRSASGTLILNKIQ